MKHYILKTLAIVTIIFSTHAQCQNGNLSIDKNKKIDSLLELKKAANSDQKSSNKYKIQIYSGTRNEAETCQSNYRLEFTKWKSTLEYETPNYKIWVGNFRTRLEAESALFEIKEIFEHAFIFKPKKKD